MKKIHILAGSAAILICTWATPSQAATASGLEGFGRPVEDAELANMRGKFVAPSGISYFGIAMTSSWQGNDGITTAATLMFSIDFAHLAAGGNVVPHIMISWSRDCPGCSDSSMNVSGFGPAASNGYVAISGGTLIPVGSLGTTTGVVQTQQIAGSDNHSFNGMSIEIVPSSQIVSDTSGMTELTHPGSESHSFSDGDTLQFDYSKQQLGLSMTDQNGALLQSVDGGLGQLAQHVLISGNNIVATNTMQLTVGMDPAAAQLNIQNALATMKGDGF